MEHLVQGMERKWERHYREARSTIAIGLVLVGLTCMVTLVFLWPQKYSSQIFNERLKFNLILDVSVVIICFAFCILCLMYEIVVTFQVDDFYLCNEKYKEFLYDEPTSDVKLLSFYIFNITNTLDVIRRGYKPAVLETGPYGYYRRSYKYDIYFEDFDSRTVSFKEYTMLEAVNDPDVCEKMFYRLDRSNLLDGNPCPGDLCKCKDPNSPIQSVNPAFLNLIWKEGPHALLSRWSIEVYENIKYNMEVLFPEVVKAHLTSKAMEEIYQFRFMMQIAKFIEPMFASLSIDFTVQELEQMLLLREAASRLPETCGLGHLGIGNCPWSGFASLFSVRFTLDEGFIKYANITEADYPSLIPYLDPSHPNSFLNITHGLSRWVGVAAQLGYMEYTFSKGFTMASEGRLLDTFQEFISELTILSFGNNPTANQRLGGELYVRFLCLWLQRNFILQYDTIRKSLVYEEWKSGSEPEICAPYGEKCLWQFAPTGGDYDFNLTPDMIYSIIDRGSKVNTNPNNYYFDGNGPYFHNSYRFCQEVLYPEVKDPVELDCADIEYTRQAATFSLPAGLASINDGVSQINRSAVFANFKKKSPEQRAYFINFGCNISYALHKTYRDATDFHDKYVIAYLNLYKDPEFEHNFTVGKWAELGQAQWGGGFVTYALLSVRSIFNVKRDGMWHFGTLDYYRGYMEYSTWATRVGFPGSWIYNVKDAEVLLNALADRSDSAFEFRRNIVFRSTTLLGDGQRFINNVGAVGEVTFIVENSEANFSCTGEKTDACNLVQAPVISSAAQCQYIEVLLYEACTKLIARRSAWVTNCDLFQTSMTSPLQGIQCDLDFVYGNAHPFTKRRGNIISAMLYSLTSDIVLKIGLFCPGYDTCNYEWGGFFVTTTAQRMLFEGYSDASVLKYLELKHSDLDLSFECLDEPFDQCGVKNYHCTHGGPTGGGFTVQVADTLFRMTYGVTPHEKYFAPYLEFTDNGTMVWTHDIDPDVRAASRELKKVVKTTEVMNPIWVAYPAWDNKTTEDWQKFYQCSMRMYSGLPDNFNSCEDTHNTGREDFGKLMNLEKFKGNYSITFFDTEIAVNGTAYEQFPAYLWQGFEFYPYTWRQLTAGPDFFTMKNPVIYDKKHAIRLTLSQTRLDSTDKPQPVAMPLRTSFSEVVPKSDKFVNARRFSQDIETWRPLKNVGFPKDPYGMPYKIPIGMTSLERFTNFPLFLGTPHNYGNIEFGGEEHQHVTGLVPDERNQMTFVDYDPITGKTLRRAIRQQVA